MKEYSERLNIQSCILYKQDIINLIQLVKDSLPGESLTLITNFDGTEITENDAECWFSNPELPQTLADFEIRASVYDPKTFQHSRYISVKLGYRATVYISGTEKIWASGVSTQFKKYFDKVKPWYYIVRKYFWPIYLIMIFASVYLLSKSVTNGKINVFALLSSGILYLSLTLFMFLTTTGRVLKTCTIYTNNKTKFNWTVDYFILMVSVLALIATVLLLFKK